MYCRGIDDPVVIRRPGTRLLALAALLAAALSCRTARSPEPAAPVPAVLPRALAQGFRVVGYLPSWRRELDVEAFTRLTHVNYAFAVPTATGALEPLPKPERLRRVVAEAHARGVKVCVSVGGWHGGDDSGFESLAADPAARARFVDEIEALITTYELDGVDIDWEYPDPGESARNYAATMRALADRLHPRGKLLTAAVVAGGSKSEGVLPEVFGLLDFVMLMAYDGDHHGTRPHAPYEYAAWSLQSWRDRGLPRDKLVLGVPFFGKRPSTAYRDLVARDSTAPSRDELGGVHYNGVATIARKTALALAEGSGIMIWEITQDAPGPASLLQAIARAVLQAAPGAVKAGWENQR